MNDSSHAIASRAAVKFFLGFANAALIQINRDERRDGGSMQAPVAREAAPCAKQALVFLFYIHTRTVRGDMPDQTVRVLFSESRVRCKQGCNRRHLVSSWRESAKYRCIRYSESSSKWHGRRSS